MSARARPWFGKFVKSPWFRLKMRSESEVTVFGRSLIVRRYQPLFAFVLLGLWVATIVPTGEWWLLPYLSVASVVAAGAVRWWLDQQVVVLGLDGLRWSTALRSMAVPWCRIISVAPWADGST